MNTGTTVLLVGGALIAFNLLNKAGTAKALVFFPDQVKGTLDPASNPILNVRLSVQNPTSQGFTIRAITANLYANTSLVGNVSSFQQVTIKPLSTSYIDLVIKVSMLGVATDLYNAITGGFSFSQKVLLAGSANVDGLNIPLNIFYKIG
jgi:hypothetical protein